MKYITDIPAGHSNGTQAILTKISNQLPAMVSHRLIIASKLDGVPRGIHAIGRIQLQFDLSSVMNLFSSINKLQRLVYLTAEVIETMEGVKMDRHQMERGEITTYVNTVVSTLNLEAPNAADLDLITILIISFEASPNNYALQAQTKKSSLHLSMTRLYEELRDMLPGEVPHFDSSNSSMSTLGVYSAAAGLDESGLDDTATIVKLAQLRVLDHVYAMLMDVNIWAGFIAPRTKADVATNLERARTLRSFAHYLQQLLIYHQFFTLEMQLQGYELIQQWVNYFPPLNTDILNRIEKVIRPHDLLGAGTDAKTFLSSLSTISSTEQKVITLPSELLGSYGLTETIKKIAEEVANIQITTTITDLGQLEKKAYLPILAGIPVAEINVGSTVAKAVLISKTVDGQVMTALTSLLPVIARKVTTETLSNLASMGLRPGIPFIAPTAVTYNVTKGVAQEVSNGVLRIDRGAPVMSYDYSEYIRKKYQFAIATDDAVYSGRPNATYDNVIDRDKAAYLQEVLATSWQSLIPSFLGTAERTYSVDTLKAEHEIRFLFEGMSGTSFEIVKKELSITHRAKMWATFLSSFALLYTSSDVNGAGNNVSTEDLQLITGYGHPYGTSFVTLESAQDATKIEDFINIGDGFYLRILNQIPVVLPELDYDDDFFGHHPATFFASNSTKVPVSKFVWSGGLTQYCMTPVKLTTTMIQAKFGTRYIYSLKRLVLNFSIFYAPMVPGDAREHYPLPIKKNTWNLEREAFFLEYRTFGDYAIVPAAISSLESATIPTLEEMARKIERKEVAEEQEAAATADHIEEEMKQLESNVSSFKLKDEHADKKKDKNQSKSDTKPKNKGTGKGDDEDAE